MSVCSEGSLEGVKIDIGMLLLEVQGRSEAHSPRAAAALMHTLLLQVGNQLVAQLGSLAVERQIGALATHVLDFGRVLAGQRVEALGQIGTDFGSKLSQIVLLDSPVLL